MLNEKFEAVADKTRQVYNAGFARGLAAGGGGGGGVDVDAVNALIDNKVGYIDEALDEIIEIQNSLITGVNLQMAESTKF